MENMDTGFFLVLSLLLLPVSAGPLCSTQENWDSNTQACVTMCNDCPVGLVRDFETDVRTKEDGHNKDSQCPPCRPCGEGQFSTRITNTCRNCSRSCRRENRQMQLPCKGDHDMICGSCLPGYVDVYDSLDFPCIKNKADPSTEDPVPDKDPPTDLKVKEHEENDGAGTPPPRHDNYWIVGTVALVLFGFMVAGCAVIVLLKLEQVPCSKRTPAAIFGSYKSISKEVIETDGGNEDDAIQIGVNTTGCGKDVEMTTYDVKTKANYVSVASYDVKMTGNANEGTVVRGELSDGWYTRAKHCGHTIPSNCGCSSDIFPDSILHRSDASLRTVALEACHDPRTLYHELHVPYNTVYQLDDDRDRQPELIPQSETILKILNGWVESSTDKPRLSTLLTALCRSGFHHITEKLLSEDR